MLFVIVGKTEKSKDDIKTAIQRMGGKLGTSIHEGVTAIISTEDMVQKMGSRMQDAKKFGIQVVPEDFLDDVKNGGAVSYIISKTLCDWGTDVSALRTNGGPHGAEAIIAYSFRFVAAAHAHSTGRSDEIEIEEHLHKVSAEITKIEVER